MGSQKKLIAFLILTLTVAGVTCAAYMGAATSFPQNSSSENSANGALLFEIGVHIEPLRGQGRGQGDYNQQAFFERHVEDIRILARLVERYGGKLTVQAQTPFTLVAIRSGETLFADLESRDHEIALHFHEDAHLGANPETLPVGTWAATLAQEISYLKQAGATRVRYWSGGNLYPGVLDAAAVAGLDVMSDWKNPHTQQTNRLVVGVNPWRPSAGPSERDLAAFARHDSHGMIIYLPDGLYDPEGFASKRQIARKGGAPAYFDFITESLERSLRAAQPDRVNVFHITIHPGEFRGVAAEPYAAVDRFLAKVVNPLVVAGKVRWATFSEMADAFVRWEKTHPGVNPRKGARVDSVHVDLASLGKVERDITYCTVDSVPLKMNVYHPITAEQPVPALVYVHGGGWTGGDKASGAMEIRELVKRGYIVAAVNYRLAPEYKFPAQIEDMKCAVRFLRTNAQVYGLDADRIGA